ncbi:hypothetical protein KY314_00275 [Candidatus Woesearchaeota archaeon]|nr:hypothetical protein [Candidatus Woesearchaeota archaeon]
MNKPIQQGDILFVPISKTPDKTKSVQPQQGKYILAEGEATGHSHAIKVLDKPHQMVKVLRNAKGLYLKVKSPVDVEHEEHGTQTIPIGDWEVKQINEWNYDEQQAQKIRD